MSKTKGKKPPPEPEPEIEPFVAGANNFDSVILLLRSSESPIQLNGLYHLEKFASHFAGNCALLHEHHLLDALYPLLKSTHRFIRRLALNILSLCFQVAAARPELEREPLVFEAAMHNYTTFEDDYLIEYSAVILKELCADRLRRQHIAGDSDLHRHLFRRIVETIDPDVLHQSLELLVLIGGHPVGVAALCESIDFPFAYMLALCGSAYPRVQCCALECLHQVAVCDSPQYTERFADPLFMAEMLGILENLHQNDLHDATIDLLCQTLRRSDMADRFRTDGLPRFMDFMDATLHHRLSAMRVLAKLAEHASAREPLFDARYTDALLGFVGAGKVPGIASGIAQMSLHRPALDELLAGDTVRMLFGILGESGVKVAHKAEVANCLQAMFMQSKQACSEALQCDGMRIVAELLRTRVRSKSDAVTLKRPLVSMLRVLAKQCSFKPHVMTDAMAKALYLTLKTSKHHPDFMIDLWQCIAQYVTEDAMQQELLNMDSHKHIIEGLLMRDNYDLRKATVDMVLATRKYPDLTDMFIDKKVLDILLDNAAVNANLPNWSAAIEAILVNNLPVKFALRGHLDLTDCTQDNFYATKKIWHKYRRLRQIFLSNCSARKPIFLSNFHSTGKTASMLSLGSNHSQLGRIIGRWMSNSSAASVCDPLTASVSEDEVFNMRPPDASLADYLRIVREALQIARIPARPQSEHDHRKCVQIIADVVSSKLCGEACSNAEEKPVHAGRQSSLMSLSSSGKGSTMSDSHQTTAATIAAHLDALKRTKYDCNVIPLGALRVGGLFERALLFKVLADQVGLPCVLHMDPANNDLVWPEVALPLYGDKLPKDCGDLPLPDVAVPTHIVDLLEEPGQLYLIGCKRAQQYLGNTR